MLNSKILRLLMLSWILTGFMSILSVNAMQVERRFPEDVKRGKLTTTALAQLVIDGKLRVDSPALRIFNEDNSIVTIASVDVRNIVINYAENDIGEIIRIWILTAEEARQPLPKKS
jgi:hypothetical protein